MDTIKIEKGKTQMVAHAGLAGLESPNTMAGVIAAGNRSYWGIEVDVRLTKDNKLVVIHNDSLMDAAGVDMLVSESTVEELQQIALFDRPFFYGMEKYGIKPQVGVRRADLRIATLEEYVRLCKKYGKIAVLELKTEMTPEVIANVVNHFREQDYLDGAVFISFFWDNLVEVRKQVPGQSVQYLTDMDTQFTDEFLDKVAQEGFDLDIHIFTTTKELVDRIHSRGIKINVWTCDWVDRAARLVDFGVEYITTNILE